MKTLQTIVLGLFFVSLHQALFCITERDVRSFGERSDYIYPEINMNTEYGRLLIAAAHQNKMSNEKATFKRQVSNPIAISQQPKNDLSSQSSVAGSPDSVWSLLISPWTSSK